MLLLSAANEEVKSVITTGKERGPYMKFSDEVKLAIARYAKGMQLKMGL